MLMDWDVIEVIRFNSGGLNPMISGCGTKNYVSIETGGIYHYLPKKNKDQRRQHK
jgi:hypothetical protein